MRQQGLCETQNEKGNNTASQAHPSEDLKQGIREFLSSLSRCSNQTAEVQVLEATLWLGSK